MATPTPEELKQTIALLERQLEITDELSEKEVALAALKRRTLLQAQNAAAEEKRLVQEIASLDQKIKTEQDKDQRALAMLKKASREEELEGKRSLADFYKKEKKDIDELIVASKKFQDQQVAGAQRTREEARGALEKASQSIQGEMEMGTQVFLDGIEGAFEGVGGALEGFTQTPEVLLASMSGMDMGISTMKAALLAMPEELDTAFSDVIKSTNVNSTVAKDSMVAMLDPLYAARKDGAFRNLAEDSELLSNIGLNAGDVGESMQALLKDVAMFRPSFIESNKSQAAFVGNLVAGLKKVGVPVETSTKNLNRFTKAMAMSPKEAATGLKQLTGIADSLGLSFGDVSANFDQVGGEMVQFGDRAVGVFANLQAQATATGMSINELTEFAQGLDTFEGAAQKAQGLNAVLGGTFVSVTDLVNADFDEKIELMQDAMGDAGIEFEHADRRMKQVIASAAGLSVEQASKFFGNKEASEEMTDTVSDQAMSQEELKKKIEEGMTITELATKNLSSMAGGVSDFNKRLKKGAEGISDIVGKEFGDLLVKTQNSEAAFGGMVAGLEAMETAGGLASKGLGALGSTFLDLTKGGVLKKVTQLGVGLTGLAAGAAALKEVSQGYTPGGEEGAKAESPETPKTEEEPKTREASEEATVTTEKGVETGTAVPLQLTTQILMPDGRLLAELIDDQNLFLKLPQRLGD